MGLVRIRVGTKVKIGHICLATPADDAGDRFMSLVAALAKHGIEQHVLVASVARARQLADCPRVTAGPAVKSPVMAYCLMPEIDLAHVHEARSGQAGLLLTLTRSIPFVMTSNDDIRSRRNPLTRSVLNRAAQLLPPAGNLSAERQAAEYLRIYRHAVDAWVRSALML